MAVQQLQILFPGDGASELIAIIERLKELEMDMNQAVATLKRVNAKATKIAGETDAQKQRIADLEAAIEAGGSTSAEFDAELAQIEATLDAIDAAVEDAPQG